MSDEQLAVQFGINVDPSHEDPDEPFQRARIADERGMDLITLHTFVFWPVAGNELLQIEAFVEEVAPAVRDELDE